jgi:hypothetical protein
MQTLPAVGDRRVEPEEQPDDEQRGEDNPGQETGNPGRKQTCHTTLVMSLETFICTVLWIRIGFKCGSKSGSCISDQYLRIQTFDDQKLFKKFLLKNSYFCDQNLLFTYH